MIVKEIKSIQRRLMSLSSSLIWIIYSSTFPRGYSYIRTLSASSCMITRDPHVQVLVVSITSWSNNWTKEDKEWAENKLKRRLRISLWCCSAAHNKLSGPKISEIDFMYFFENFPPSFRRITFADSLLEIKTWVSPNNLVLKQFPYLHWRHTHLSSMDKTNMTIWDKIKLKRNGGFGYWRRRTRTNS
jgi:hypothetical protein